VQVPTPNGPAWRVTPSVVPTLDGALGSAPSSPSHAEAGYLADLVRQLAERAEANAAAAAMWQARAQHLADQLEQLQHALPSASTQRPVSGDSEHVVAETTQRPSPSPKRAWWRFWSASPA
jgi:hypothetical protein